LFEKNVSTLRVAVIERIRGVLEQRLNVSFYNVQEVGDKALVVLLRRLSEDRADVDSVKAILELLSILCAHDIAEVRELMSSRL
jgi:hypothetical protein